jgi:hypothetical protein
MMPVCIARRRGVRITLDKWLTNAKNLTPVRSASVRTIPVSVLNSSGDASRPPNGKRRAIWHSRLQTTARSGLEPWNLA